MSLKGGEGDGAMAWRAMHGKTTLDAALVCVLIVVLAAAMMMYLDRLTREARETALRMGLGNIRMSVRLYQALNERYPKDVKELLTTGYLLPTKEDTIFSDRYLDAQALDADGYPVDPFGHRYEYDPKQGRVASSTRGYEQW
jgi:type II secretory pathway pseudopilin PulG